MHQLGRVENDHIPLPVVIPDHGPEVAEGIGVHPVNAFDLIEVGVPLGLGDGFFIQVDGGDFGGSSEEFSCQGKSSGITTEVEDAFAADQRGEPEAVFALVAEEAGLVAFLEIHFIAHAMLAAFHGAHRALGDRFRADAFDAGDIVIHPDQMTFGSQQPVQSRHPFRQALPDAEAVDIRQ